MKALQEQLSNGYNYYPFGMMMPGRKYEAASGYRYGFNGKENDNEVKGEGNQQDYGMRIYDSRLGRFLSVDPLSKKYPELTPYQFASNKPISCIDIDGEENLDYRFSASLSLNFSRAGGVRFSVSTAAGISYTAGPVQMSSSSNINIYNGGLGTPGNSNRVQFDVSTSVYLTVGVGHFDPSQTKTINYRTISPINNNYAGSISFGNAFSYSSGTMDDNKQAFVNIKAGPVTVDYHNDSKLFGPNLNIIDASGKDQDFSGGTSITLNTNALGGGELAGNISVGFEVYTGMGTYKGYPAPKNLSKLPSPEDNSTGNIFYDQGTYQRSLNKSSSFIQVGNTISHDDNGGKGQNDIHTGKGFSIFGLFRVGKRVNNPRFHYDKQGQRSVESTLATTSFGIN